jgi:hypothetical protein
LFKPADIRRWLLTSKLEIVIDLGFAKLPTSAIGTKRTSKNAELMSAFGARADYGSLDDPQSQPPAGTSVAAQNVSVPFVWSIFQIAGYGAALWWAKGESSAGPGGIAPTLFTALEHSIESKLIGIS